MTAGAVLDPATDMRLRHNRGRAQLRFPGFVWSVDPCSPASVAAQRWVGLVAPRVGPLWIELPPQMGEP
jgi:hypothetical protein